MRAPVKPQPGAGGRWQGWERCLCTGTLYFSLKSGATFFCESPCVVFRGLLFSHTLCAHYSQTDTIVYRAVMAHPTALCEIHSVTLKNTGARFYRQGDIHVKSVCVSEFPSLRYVHSAVCGHNTHTHTYGLSSASRSSSFSSLHLRAILGG